MSTSPFLNLFRRGRLLMVRALSVFHGEAFFKLTGLPQSSRLVRSEEKTVIYTKCFVPNETVVFPKGQNPPHFSFPERMYPEAFVARIQKGFSTPEGYNFSKQSELLPELSYESLLDCYYPRWNETPQVHEFALHNRVPTKQVVRKIPGRVVSLSSRFQDNYFHWLFDVLPRLDLLEKSRLEYDLLYIRAKSPFQLKSLELLNINLEKCIFVEDGTSIQAEELIVPTIPSIPGTVPEWACCYLQKALLKKTSLIHPAPEQRPLLYITRRRAARRRILNEDAVRALLESHGFQIVYPEDLEFDEQIKLFSTARCVVSAHGAGLSNIVFAPDDLQVLELFSCKYINPCYWHLSQALQFDYRAQIDGPCKETIDTMDWDCFADLTVDLEELETNVARMLEAQSADIDDSLTPLSHRNLISNGRTQALR